MDRTSTPRDPAESGATSSPAGQGARHGALQPRVGAGRLPRALDAEFPALFTLRQAAAYLAVSYWTVRAWVDAGKLAALRLPGDGRLVRVERAELDRLIAASR